MGNLLTVPRQPQHQQQQHQHYHEYVNNGGNWESAAQSGASIAHANSVQHHASVSYRNYASATSAYYQQPSRPNSLFGATANGGLLMTRGRLNGTDVAEVYANPCDVPPYDPAQTRLNYWANERRPPIVPVIREPTSDATTFLTIPSQYASSERYPQGYTTAATAAQVHQNPHQPSLHYQQQQQSAGYAAAAGQYGYYSDDKTELVFPAVRNRPHDDYLDAQEEQRESEQEERKEFKQESCATVHCEETEYACNEDQQTQEDTREVTDEEQPNPPSWPEQNAIEEDEEEDEQSAEKACSADDANQFVNSDSPSSETAATVVPTPKLHTVMPELNLDLSGLNSSDVSSSSDSDNIDEAESNDGEKCWKSPEEVRLGCGRVAALAKHFSQLGEAGLIKFRSRRFAGSRQFVSEPDIATPTSAARRRAKESADAKFKSESELLRTDKSVSTTPEKEWSMILLDIQAKGCLELEEDRGKKERRKEKTKVTDNENGSKLSLAEQEQIIEQLKEFSNLDNADAPLFIPSKEDSDYVENDSEENTSKTTKQPRTLIAGSVRLEHFRNHSLPTILSTLNVFPSSQQHHQRCSIAASTVVGKSKAKVNSLSKYWSLKDLASSDELVNSTHTSQDDMLNERSSEGSSEARYTVFPTCSRVVSAPEITDERLVGYPTAAVTIKSTISICGHRRLSDESGSTSSFHSTVRLSKSTSDISRDGQPDDEDDEDDEADENGRSKSWEKLTHTCAERHHRHSRRHSKRTDSRQPCAGSNKLVKRRTRSELDISERKPTPRFERSDWIYRDIPQQQRRQRTESRKPAGTRRRATLPERFDTC